MLHCMTRDFVLFIFELGLMLRTHTSGRANEDWGLIFEPMFLGSPTQRSIGELPAIAMLGWAEWLQIWTTARVYLSLLPTHSPTHLNVAVYYVLVTNDTPAYLLGTCSNGFLYNLWQTRSTDVDHTHHIQKYIFFHCDESESWWKLHDIWISAATKLASPARCKNGR